MNLLYVEFINQRYDDVGEPRGPFSVVSWFLLVDQLGRILRATGHATSLRGTSYNRGSDNSPEVEAYLVELFDDDAEAVLKRLRAFRDKVAKKGGVVRLLKTEQV